ncbi:hypothetical protein OG982_12605 [Streptomyces sp. NBC_01551]|uniref:hypothetical protein n=1 Tax=Streptomyces sp. NBC_01551 TaxID=2975876 RepID=UPI00224EE47C|nr:hypothetical protein [Streptomyces sp. NBC_01551]MCX4526515.1 hypothetical protein [Streptomyces sp. NBC_01551]
MGIESDQLVYEYLSRVGDLAQRRQLPSGDRMRLVAGLRDEIDRRRAKYEPETQASVRKILERIGTPEEVLDTLGTLSGPDAAAAAPVAAVPAQRGPDTPRAAVNVPPHLAGLDELGPSDGAEPDWWRVTPGPFGRGGPQVEGFAGGIEIPDLFKEPEEEDAPAPEPDPPASPRGRALLRFAKGRLRAKKPAADPSAPAAEPRPKPHAFLLLAAAILAAGAVSGYWLLLVVGFAAAYASRVLGPTERKVVVFGLPGAVFAGAVVWLWGRQRGRWGTPLADDALSDTLPGMWPWLARAAGLASALYLTWRARRR